MSLRTMFEHKYPITNLHEVDLTNMHNEIDELIAIMDSWEQIIEQLQEGLNHLDVIDGRLDALESITSGLNQAYLDIEALKTQVGKNVSDIVAIKAYLENFETTWENVIELLTEYAKQLVKSEERERKAADYDLDVKIEQLRISVYDDISILYQMISEIVPTDVYNPVRGIRENLDKNNADVYGDLRYGGFTNAELSEFGISNDYVASLVHNNRDYALNAKFRFKRHWMFSPWTGIRCPHYNAISEMYVVGIGGANNTQFYAAIAADSKTNDDLADYIVNNKSRYLYMV